jgi:four helix bundle protein
MEEKKIFSYRDLIVWQKSMDFVDLIYQQTDLFPDSEKFGLTNQIRRSAVSIPSNIAEGNLRGSRAEYARFLLVAFASAGELDTQLEIAKRRGYISSIRYQKANETLIEILKMLNSLIKKLQQPSP